MVCPILGIFSGSIYNGRALGGVGTSALTTVLHTLSIVEGSEDFELAVDRVFHITRGSLGMAP